MNHDLRDVHVIIKSSACKTLFLLFSIELLFLEGLIGETIRVWLIHSGYRDFQVRVIFVGWLFLFLHYFVNIVLR